MEARAAAATSGRALQAEDIHRLLRWVAPTDVSLPLPIRALEQLRSAAFSVYCRAADMPTIGIAEDNSALLLPDGTRVSRVTFRDGCRRLYDAAIEELSPWFSRTTVESWVEQQEGPVLERPVRHDDKASKAPGYYMGKESKNKVEEWQRKLIAPLVIHRQCLHSMSLDVSPVAVGNLARGDYTLLCLYVPLSVAHTLSACLTALVRAGRFKGTTVRRVHRPRPADPHAAHHGDQRPDDARHRSLQHARAQHFRVHAQPVP